MWQGILICASLAAGGFLLANTPGIAGSGISPLVLSLLLGLLVGNLPIGKRCTLARPGLQFATRWLLRSGIVLFGLSLTLQQILGLGIKIFILDMLVISIVILIGYWIGTRLLGLDRETTILTSAGSAICGAAAILATESTIRSKPAATAMAIATVVLFGSISMLLYPLLYPFAGIDEGLFGIYIGATVHEVAQVVAAGDAVGPDALTNAVIVKLVRVMLLVPFLLILGQWWIRLDYAHSGTESGRTKLIIPWFAFGFLAMVIFNSIITLPIHLHGGLVLSGQVALTMAMAALGVETRIEKLKALGLKPFLLAFILFIMLLVGGLGLTRIIIG